MACFNLFPTKRIFKLAALRHILLILNWKTSLHLVVRLFFFRSVRKIENSFYYLCQVCPSVRTEQLSSRSTDFDEIYYLIIFEKSIEKDQVPLKYEKNNVYFTRKPICIYIYINFFISRSVLHAMYIISDRRCRENQNTHVMFSNCFSKIAPFVR